MAARELICSEVWGGNRDIYTDIVIPGLSGVLYSKASNSIRGGDVYYASACSAGVIGRVCIADVAGHGDQVVEVSSWLHGTLRRNMNRSDPRRIFAQMNRRVTLFGLEAMTTAVCITYNLTDRQLFVCYAGHPSVLLYQPSIESWRELDVVGPGAPTANIPFGVAEDARYDLGCEALEPGSRLCLYSDGVLEAPDSQLNLFGLGRLKRTLQEGGKQTICELGHTLAAGLRLHIGSDRFDHDDVTFVLLEAAAQNWMPKTAHLIRNQTRRVARALARGETATQSHRCCSMN